MTRYVNIGTYYVVVNQIITHGVFIELVSQERKKNDFLALPLFAFQCGATETADGSSALIAREVFTIGYTRTHHAHVV